MRRWLRLLPLLITALWLPLQAVAGITMPFCRHATEQAAPAATDAQEVHCPEHAGNAGHEAPPASNASGHDCQDCDGCELCHLASAGYMPTPASMMCSVPAASHFVALPQTVFPSHIPEPPQYPPEA